MNTRVDPLIGMVLNERYRIDAKIARGGMAMVYRGTDLRLDREIAIKVMHEHLISDDTFVERFRREAINAGRLSHPNLVAIHDQARDGDIVYLVMEYLPSVTLRKELRHRGRFTPRQAIVVLDAILSALEAVHSTGIIHRDLKPDNVLLGTDGQVKLADFGLARAVSSATTTKTLIGTVGYVAPELVTRAGADARTDLYTVGIMFYEMLTGAQPYTDDVPIQVAYRHVHDTVPPPSEVVPGLSPRLDALVLWATSKDPDDRPADAAEFRFALAEARAEMSDAELDLGSPVIEPSGQGPALTASIDLGADAPKEKKSRTDEIPYLDEDEDSSGADSSSAAGAGHSGAEVVAGDSGTAAGAAIGGAAAGAASASADDPDSDAVIPDASAAPAAATSASSPAVASAAVTPARRRRRRRLATTIAAACLVLVLTAWLIIANLPTPTPNVVVPAQLAGKQLDEVTTTLSDAGLQPEAKEVFDDSIPAGVVIGTDPIAGAELAPDSAITIVVSKGEQLFAVPELAGLTLEKAKAALAKAKLKSGDVSEEFDDTVAKGTVISAATKPGTKVSAGTQVDLTVSKGDKPIAVPNVEGLTYEAAFGTLTKRGFRVGRGDVFSKSVPKGKVVYQSPKSSQSRAYDSLIMVYVSKGPEKADKPAKDDAKKKDSASKDAGSKSDAKAKDTKG